MANLDSLIRFRKHRVDEKQKFLSQLSPKVEQFLSQDKDDKTSIEESFERLGEIVY